MIYNGVEFGSTARLPRGVLVSGGVTLGRVAVNSCFVVDSPQALRFCDVRPPFTANIKLYGIYPLPFWGLQTSVTVQSLPGPQITATYPATSAAIAPSLGRPLSTGANATANVELIQPGTLYAPRLNQVDFRMAKNFKIGRTRVLGSVDVFNLFNRSGVQTLNTQYGSSWLRPLDIQIARYVKFSGQLTF